MTVPPEETYGEEAEVLNNDLELDTEGDPGVFDGSSINSDYPVTRRKRRRPGRFRDFLIY